MLAWVLSGWVFFTVTLLAGGVQAGQAEPFSSPVTVPIPAGAFIMGSDRAERNAAYDLDEAAYGHSVTRTGRWYEGEKQRQSVTLESFTITRTPITNAQYQAFITDTIHPAPSVDEKTWTQYGLAHSFKTARRHSWTDRSPPPNRQNHPVVLVSHDDALAYAGWLSRKTGQIWRLPSEAQWEKAMRGTDGRRFGWGDTFTPTALNSHDNGPFDTTPVGSFKAGASPFGVLDGAGQVFEWTAEAAPQNRFIVKGGSWDDQGCGVCRPAARHSRPKSLKHVLIGFRLIQK
ncbi:MAG: hypothetical protein COB59_07920 [Rhodospirillaceae bacterium]|nr:MAG: hypothetical protein COB59_07920 [Rhodospirillaceae bacterium]